MKPWQGAPPPELPKPNALGYVLVALRFVGLATTFFGILPFVLLLRTAGAPVSAARLASFATRMGLRVIGLRLVLHGRPDMAASACVANHGSWIDTLVLNAAHQVRFVSKSDVAGWPLIGFLARAMNTVFIERRRTAAGAQKEQMRALIDEGSRPLFFPEGTSTDSLRVIPFRSSLFESFLAAGGDDITIQPVSVRYIAPKGQLPSFYGWWGGMTFVPHFMAVMSRVRQGSVHVSFLDVLPVSSFEDRKALAQAAEKAVREGFDQLSRDL